MFKVVLVDDEIYAREGLKQFTDWSQHGFHIIAEAANGEEALQIIDIRAAIERYASLGLQLQLTELDMSVFEHEDRRMDLVTPTDQMTEQLSERYEQVFGLMREYSEYITAVTFWGAADNYTWLDHFPVRGRKNWPLLFDEQQQPKQAFWRVVKGLN